MRTSIAIATFLAVGAGAVGVGAATITNNMKGSDTLKDLTKALLADVALDCGGTGNTPAGTMTYQGNGSGAGESALLGTASPIQLVAPMSRFLTQASTNATCTGAGASPTTAEGIIFALDGLAILSSLSNASQDTRCNNTGIIATGGATNLGGINYDKTVPLAGGGSYLVNNWRDALRVLYLGIDHSNTKDCNSLARQALVSNWSNLFEGTTAGSCPAAAPILGGGAATSSTCTQISSTNTAGKVSAGRACPAGSPAGAHCSSPVAFNAGLQHAYRRDDESGSTDVFLTLLGVPNSLVPNNPLGLPAVPVATTNLGNAQPAGVAEPLGSSAFCNVHPTAPVPAGAVAAADPALPAPIVAGSPDPQWNAPPSDVTNPAAPIAVVSAVRNPWTTDAQDWDPIRRTCQGTAFPPASATATQREDVCSARGDMGIVLAIHDSTGGGAAGGGYHTSNKHCNATGLGNAAVAARWTDDASKHYKCRDGRTPTLVGTLDFCYECPNGGDTDPPGSATCDVAINVDAVSGAQDAACVPTRLVTPPGVSADGRVFGSWGYASAAGAAPLVNVSRGTANSGNQNISLVSAYYRIHEQDGWGTPANTLPPASSICQKADATDTIGCLVGGFIQADNSFAGVDPCSFGYAGRVAADPTVNPNTVRVKVNGIDNEIPAVQELISTAAGATGDPDNDPKLYPIARKLYLNTEVGFDRLSTLDTAAGQPELKVATCFANGTATAKAVTPAFGFVDIGVTPYCQDFDETICGLPASPATGCANNTGAFPSRTTP